MWNNKWVILIVVLAIVFGLLIITNAHFNIGGGMGSKSITFAVQ